MASERAPRISANKLGEYMVATPARRRGIIRDQKKPPTTLAARYQAAEAPVLDYLTSGNVDHLHKAAGRLRATTGGSAWAQGDRASTVDALEALSRMHATLFGAGFTFRAPPARPAKLSIGGLPISVQPDALVFAELRGQPVVGALKIHFIKNDDSALTPKGAEYVATVLHQWAMKHGPSGRVASPKLSLSVDVFRGTVVSGPASQARRIADLEAACEEILARWPTL